MDEKVTLQYLIELFSKENRIAKDWGDSFVKAFFDLIREGLEKDRIVKIKGLGTFKIIDIEPRESVNVNTGERFQIEGHSKVSFTPDASLKEIVNQPFADFETVILNEGVSFENKQDFEVEAIEDTTGDADDSETVTDEETADSRELNNEDISSETEENNIAEEAKNTNEELPKDETTNDDNTETAEAGPNAITDGISELMLSDTIADAESLIKELQSEQQVPEIETSDSPENNVLKETAEEKKDENVQSTEITEAKTLNEETKQSVILEPESENSEVKPVSIEVPKAEANAVDQIIAHELMQAPAPKISYKQKESISKKKKKKRMSINPSVAMGILTFLIIGAFGIVIYWMLAPESVDTEIKPLYNQSSSTGNKDTMADDSLNNNKDTLTLAEKALLLAQQDQATDSDDSNKIRTAMLLLNAERNKKVPSKKASKINVEKRHEVHQTPIKKSTSEVPKKQENKVIIKGLKTTHVMGKGENLYTIAKKYLGSKDKVKYLIKYNNFKNPDLVKIGTKVRIPALSE